MSKSTQSSSKLNRLYMYIVLPIALKWSNLLLNLSWNLQKSCRIAIFFFFVTDACAKFGGVCPWQVQVRLMFFGKARSLPSDCSTVHCFNSWEHIRHLCRITTVLTWHRCLINTAVEKRTAIIYSLEFWQPDVSKNEQMMVF